MKRERCLDLSSVLAAAVVLVIGLSAVAMEHGCATQRPALSRHAEHAGPSLR